MFVIMNVAIAGFAATGASAAPTATNLVGTFQISAGADAGSVSGSYFRMLEPHGVANVGPYIANASSAAADKTYTLFTPGADGGLSTAGYQPAPATAFDKNGNALATRIVQPVSFFGKNFSVSTEAKDPQTAKSVPQPSITYDGVGHLTGNLSAYGAWYNGGKFNQGAPSPGGVATGLTAPFATGTYNGTTHAYTLDWTATIVGGPFNGFTGQWHLEGVFSPALVGTFRVTAGAGAGSVSGSYFRMLEPGGKVNAGPYIANASSAATDKTYTLFAPGTDGGLSTAGYQPAPAAGFDAKGNALASRIVQPVSFFGKNFSVSTETTDPQTGTAVPAPTITESSAGILSGDVRAFGAWYNNGKFNQGAPKPDGSDPGLTSGPTGTYNETTHAYTLDWTSAIVGGPFNGFTGQWHLEGIFLPTALNLVGTFNITAGSDTGSVSGSYFRMLEPHGVVNVGPYIANASSAATDNTYTLFTPGSDGGLSTAGYQPAPAAGFDAKGNALASRIVQPVSFFGLNFSVSTEAKDPQTATAVPAPALREDGAGHLSGDLRSFGAWYNKGKFNQGAPKPDGSDPGLTSGPTGTYNEATHAYTLDWTSAIVGGPFNGFTGQWHLEGTFVPATFGIATTKVPTAKRSVAYRTQLSTVGASTAVSWTLQGAGKLPAGLTLSATGLLSGKAAKSAAAGSYKFTVTATTANTATSTSQVASRQLTLTLK